MVEASPQRVLITGGSGFIGTNLVEALAPLAGEVVSLDSAAPRHPGHRERWREADLLDAPALADAIAAAAPTHVVHLAARTDLDGDSIADYRANTDGVGNLLTALGALERPPRLLVASTQLVCRSGYQPTDDDEYCPTTPYGESKAETERIVRAHRYAGEWTIVRPTSIWGPWFGVPYRDFFLAVARGRYVHPAGERAPKSFGYVENACHQIAGLLRAPAERIDAATFYIADYEPLELGRWAELIGAAAGARPVRTAPLPLLRAAATAGDALKRLGWEGVPLTRFRLENILAEMVYDTARTRAVVPELPVDLEEGVRRTVAWLRATGDLAATKAAA